MAKFFVGQRVRLVGEWHSPLFPSPRGQVGVVIGCGEYKSLTGMLYSYTVSVPILGLKVLANAHELEPILPEGHQPVEMSKLLTEFPELEQVLGVSA